MCCAGWRLANCWIQETVAREEIRSRSRRGKDKLNVLEAAEVWGNGRLSLKRPFICTWGWIAGQLSLPQVRYQDQDSPGFSHTEDLLETWTDRT